MGNGPAFNAFSHASAILYFRVHNSWIPTRIFHSSSTSCKIRLLFPQRTCSIEWKNQLPLPLIQLSSSRSQSRAGDQHDGLGREVEVLGWWYDEQPRRVGSSTVSRQRELEYWLIVLSKARNSTSDSFAFRSSKSDFAIPRILKQTLRQTPLSCVPFGPPAGRLRYPGALFNLLIGSNQLIVVAITLYPLRLSINFYSKNWKIFNADLTDEEPTDWRNCASLSRLARRRHPLSLGPRTPTPTIHNSN